MMKLLLWFAGLPPGSDASRRELAGELGRTLAWALIASVPMTTIAVSLLAAAKPRPPAAWENDAFATLCYFFGIACGWLWRGWRCGAWKRRALEAEGKLDAIGRGRGGSSCSR